MRLHRLTMTGIGPYPGTETVDFDRFADSGRFLLTGPTGAGKSTIIDAIVFALYGEVADSTGSSRHRIRSILVDGATHSEVDLVFSTSDGVYRVLRSPEYQRPKRRGTGMTRQNATVKLWRLSAPDGEPLDEPVTRLDEAGADIRRAVGLSRDQFTQTVVLPQGKFAQFLRATSEERHTLLRDVFGTGIFDALQAELAERRRQVERATEDARRDLRYQATVLVPLLPDPACEEPPEHDGEASLDALPSGGPAPEAGKADDAPGTAPAAPGTSGTAAMPGTAAGSSHATSSRDSRPDATDEPADTTDVSSTPVSSPSERLLTLIGATAPDAHAIAELGRQALDVARDAAVPIEEALTAADAARQAAAADLSAQTSLQERLSRRARLLEEQAQLDARVPVDKAEAARLDAARRAATVAPAIRQARQAGTAAIAALQAAKAGLEPSAVPENLRSAGTAATSGLTSLLTEPDTTGSADRTASPQDRAPGAAQPSAARAPGAAHTPTTPDPGATPDLLSIGSPAAENATVLLDSAQGTAELLSARARQLRTEAGALSALVETEAGLTSRTTQLETSRADLAAEDEQCRQESEELAARPSLHAELSARLVKARSAQAEVPELRVARDAAAMQLQAGQQAEALEARIAASQESVTAAAKAATRAGDVVSQRRRAWIAATAGSIVTELVEGEPCPVCGSTEHPAPVSPDADAVSRADVEAAEADQQRKDAALTTRRKEHDALVAEQATALQACGGRSPAELSTALAAAQEALDSAERAAEPAAALEAQVEDFAQVTQALRDTLEEHRTRLAEHRTRLEAQEQALAADRERCLAARTHHDSVVARRRSLSEAADAHEDAADLLAHAAAAVRAALDSRNELAHVVGQAGFSSATRAAHASLSATELAALQATVDAAAAARSRVHHALTQDEFIASLTGTETADVHTATLIHEQTEAAYATALAARERSRAELTRLEQAVAAVDEAAVALSASLEDNAALLEVAALAEGRNSAATPLATWVLLERFAEVLTFANARLSQMSSGRYELTHVSNESGSARRKDRGLGLAVVDRFGATGTRDPRTLSGGETFYVSLSLALALADVVTAEAGGISMETLFIDEGFGSLDPETLQAVLAELGHLQAGGRTVGIVSHVEEMRRQIPDRIEVTRTPTGSTLTITAP